MDSNQISNQLMRIMIHKTYVDYAMSKVIENLMHRSNAHDLSKTNPIEFETYAKYVPELEKYDYGTKEYNEVKELMSSAIESHFTANRHHLINKEENHDKLNLFDLIESLCDWYAVNLLNKTSIEDFYEKQDFIKDPTLRKLIENTIPFFEERLSNPITDKKRNIFAFDVESDGLLGEPFYIGATVIDRTYGDQIDSFIGDYPLDLKDEWVKKNVKMSDKSIHYPDKISLYEAFYNFLKKYEDDSILIYDVGAPVETNLIRDIISELKGIDRGMEEHPYIILDLASVLEGYGYNPDLDRFKFAGLDESLRHDPFWDAMSTALIYQRLTKGF